MWYEGKMRVDCECPDRLHNPDVHGCQVRPTELETLNGVPTWLCYDCLHMADVYDREKLARGISLYKG
jgi:hypothetical protein